MCFCLAGRRQLTQIIIVRRNGETTKNSTKAENPILLFWIFRYVGVSSEQTKNSFLLTLDKSARLSVSCFSSAYTNMVHRPESNLWLWRMKKKMRKKFSDKNAQRIKCKHIALINAPKSSISMRFFFLAFRHDVVAVTAFYSRLLQNVNLYNFFVHVSYFTRSLHKWWVKNWAEHWRF